MLLGLLVHAPLVYMIPELAWEFEFYTKVPPLDPIISAVNAWIHFWRMPTFFILAGFLRNWFCLAAAQRHFYVIALCGSPARCFSLCW